MTTTRAIRLDKILERIEDEQHTVTALGVASELAKAKKHVMAALRIQERIDEEPKEPNLYGLKIEYDDPFGNDMSER